MKRHLLALALISTLPLAMTATAAMAQAPDLGWAPQDHGYDHHDDHHDNGHHGGWDKHYKRGDRLPDRYRGHEYYVTDYSRYHLRAPPSGYHWIRGDDGQFVLVAVATGLIVQEVLSH